MIKENFVTAIHFVSARLHGAIPVTNNTSGNNRTSTIQFGSDRLTNFFLNPTPRNYKAWKVFE